MKWLDRLYLKFLVGVCKIKSRIKKRRTRNKLIKHIASVVANLKDNDLYVSNFPYEWSYEDVKQICDDLNIPYTTARKGYAFCVYLDREKI